MKWTPKIPDSSPARTSNSIKLEIFSSKKHLFLDNSVSACCLSAKLPDHGFLVYVFFIKSAFSFLQLVTQFQHFPESVCLKRVSNCSLFDLIVLAISKGIATGCRHAAIKTLSANSSARFPRRTF